MKNLTKHIDKTFGALLRAFLRYGLVHPLILLNYRVTIDGVEHAVNCTDGAIVVANHSSYADGPFVLSAAWPLARIRTAVWHEEYRRPLLWPFMKLFGAISVGSPKHLPEEERHRRKEKAMLIMDKVLSAGQPLLIFPEGGIGRGTGVSIQPHLSGVHDLIAAHPEKPVLLVKIDGLQFSLFGRCPRYRWHARLPVRVTIRRFDHVSLQGGPCGLNRRLEEYFNNNAPLTTMD